MGAQKKKPELRFEGFTDAWEVWKLSEVINDIADGPFGSNLKTVHYTDEKEARIIQLSNIGESGWKDENVRYTTFEHAKEIKRCIVQENELVMAKMMPAGLTIERPKTDKMYVLSSDAVRIKLNDTLVDSKYFVYITKSNYFLDQINNDAQGSTRTRTSISKIKEMQISTPIFKEQKKIGSFFKNLDNLITMQQRKLDKLINIKKSLLEKMFSKNGAVVPEIRFKGFTDDWEQREMREILTETRRPIKMEDSKKYQLVTAKRRNEGIVSRGYLKGKDILVKSYFELKAGDYLISKRQVVHGATGIVPENLDGAIVSNEYLVSTENENITTEFLTILSKLPQMYKMFFLSSYGVDIEKLVFNVEDWKKRKVSIPALAEQKKIANYFVNLDNLITLHQRKLEKLKNIKKSCLDKMFV